MAGMIDWALWYANGGLKVFPLKPAGKDPVTQHGFYDATTDPDLIRDWWAEEPSRNIGIATGEASGNIVVIDEDYHPERNIDGKEFLRSWEADHGKLPDTWTATSGTGGTHLFFRGNGSEHCSEDKDHKFGIDVRATGGYVVAPPSVHPCGKRYEWDLAPGEIELASADNLVHEFIQLVQGEQNGKKEKLHLPVVIEQGGRNSTLYKAACSMQSTGFPDEAIEAAIWELNRISCKPPLPDWEVKRTLNSALTKEKGGKMPGWMETGKLMRQWILTELQQELKSSKN